MTKPQAARRPTSVKKTITLPRLDIDETTGKETRTERELTLIFDFTAIAVLEDLYDLPLKEIGEKFKDTSALRIRDVQRMLYAGLRTHHGDIDLAGTMTLLDEAVGAGMGVGSLLSETFSAFDAGAGQEERKTGEDPQTAG